MTLADRGCQISVCGRKQLREAQSAFAIPGGNDVAVAFMRDRALLGRRREGNDLAEGERERFLLCRIERVTVTNAALDATQK